MQQRGLRVPVVVMSGGGFAPRDELLQMARACGASATLVKPFSPRDLEGTVEGALRVAAA